MSMGVDNRFKRVQNRYKSVKSISENNLNLHLKISKKQILSQKYQFAITFDKKLAKIFLERARAKRLLVQKKKIFCSIKSFARAKNIFARAKFFFFKTHLK
jgi:hypothetical protein